MRATQLYLIFILKLTAACEVYKNGITLYNIESGGEKNEKRKKTNRLVLQSSYQSMDFMLH